ncbi:AAA family ATPase [Priestia taiwanensis]|uniref:Nuclease SbcCD subunit C n=1 Tax=Priestia taiwanensis TaxID=1347902 RepID=A0A917ALU3_9BACI|nr:SMC family ATPase [Priestia taiwanensis]MBM7362305.1 exonuclease SbcC [Priestia taiwanensis]GGE61101.1 nuclease SbcCD subunit C [Priestia taiwanensis]
MKPLKLQMTAFGPYKGAETIDFSKLEGNLLFAIAGNTGAGKTTIFDAISYALYGEASGEERSDSKTLRSHFADEEVHTSVALHFSLKGDEYYIVRQMPHKKGNNKTETGGSIELYEVKNGEHIPAVDRFHVNDVKDKIYDLIGLTKEQFSQIVMLPQGEFRKLLTSETENKEQILRRVFKTEHYKLIRDLLDTRRKKLEKGLQGKQAERDIYFRNVAKLPLQDDSSLLQAANQEYKNSNAILQGLAEEIARHEEKMNHDKDIIQQEELLLKQQETNLHHAKTMNQQLEALQHKEREYEALTQQQETIGQQEQTLLLAEKAEALAIYEELFRKATNELSQKKQQLEHLTSEKEILSKQVELVTKQYEEEKQKELLRITKQKEHDHLLSLKEIIEQLHEKERTITVLNNQIKAIEEQVKVETLRYEEKTKERHSLQVTIADKEKSVLLLTKKQEELHKLRQGGKVIKKYIEEYKKGQETYTNYVQLQAQYEQAMKKYDVLENEWLEGQASMLAVHLKHGELCPVCGSTEHPSKATSHGNVIDKPVLAAAKEKRDATEKQFLALSATKTQIESNLRELQQELKDFGYSHEDIDSIWNDVVEQGKTIGKEVQTLEQDVERVNTLREELSHIEKVLEHSLREQQKYQQTLQELKLQLVQHETSYKMDIKQLPESMTTLNEWQEAYHHVQASLQQLLQAWQHVQQVYEQTMQRNIRIQADYEHGQKEVTVATDKHTKEQQRFLQELEKAKFTDDVAYSAAKRTNVEKETLKQTIENYRTTLQKVLATMEQLKGDVKEAQWADVSALQEKIEQTSIELDIKKELYLRTENLIQAMKELNTNIKAVNTNIYDEEKVYQQVIDLYEVIKGNNESRISFERYILIEYLEQIIEAANLRLHKLSNGQFSLQRSERVEKRNRQSGLGLDVYDSYTGTLRDVKTLSGGEKFNASLCLALGMADVIQAFQGGISIETMFIDEGFGSLDEESLAKAIDTLIELQQAGRLIGVISHVQELKDAMPAVLEVKKTKEGFSKTTFVVK